MTCIYEFHLAMAKSLSLSLSRTSVRFCIYLKLVSQLSVNVRLQFSKLPFNLCSFRNAKLSPLVKNVSWSNGAIILKKGVVEPIREFFTPCK